MSPFGHMPTRTTVPVVAARANPLHARAAAAPLGLPLSVWALMLVAVFLLRLALVPLNAASLHVDEAQYWDWSRDLQWGYYSKPPAVALLIAASSAMFGDSELGLRVLAMACYPLTALVLWALGRDIESSSGATPRRAVGVWAAALFMASPLAGFLGLVATTDALLLLCWSLALWSLWHALNGPKQGRLLPWAGFALACGVGLLDKYTMAALLPGAALWVWRRGDRDALWCFALATATALGMWTPHLAWNQQAGWPTLRHTAEMTLHRQGHGSVPLAFKAWVEFALAQLLLLAPLVLPWLLYQRWRQPSISAAPAVWTPNMSFLGWTSLPLLAMGLIQSARGHAEVNWIAPVQLAVALALALRFAPASETGEPLHPVAWSTQRRWATLLCTQLLLVFALGAAPLLQKLIAPTHALPVALDAWARLRGWPLAFAELAPAWQRARAEQPDTVLIGTSRTVLAQAIYQWRDLSGGQLDRLAWAPGAVAGSHYELTCPWSPHAIPAANGPGARPWLLLSEGPPPSDLADLLGGVQVLAKVQVRQSINRVIDLQLSGPLLQKGGETARISNKLRVCP